MIDENRTDRQFRLSRIYPFVWRHKIKFKCIIYVHFTMNAFHKLLSESNWENEGEIGSQILKFGYFQHNSWPFRFFSNQLLYFFHCASSITVDFHEVNSEGSIESSVSRVKSYLNHIKSDTCNHHSCSHRWPNMYCLTSVINYLLPYQHE